MPGDDAIGDGGAPTDGSTDATQLDGEDGPGGGDGDGDGDGDGGDGGGGTGGVDGGDENQCAEDSDDCDDDPEACVDLPEGFMCACPVGTVDADGSGDDCEPDECALGIDSCDDTPNACIDGDGTFRCECPDGYADVNGDGSVCQGIPTPLDQPDGEPYLGLYPLGLYGDADNTMPSAHRQAGIALANAVEPLDVNGNPSATGRIVMMSIGMSNTSMELCTAMQATPPLLDPADPTRVQCAVHTFMGRARLSSDHLHPLLSIVNGAYPGQALPSWESPNSGLVFMPIPPNPAFPTAVGNYDRVRDHVLPRYTPSLTEAQVQVVWIKLASGGPTVSLPHEDADAMTMVTSLSNVLRTAKQRYPNLKLAFLTTRTYGGYASGTFSPEPYAYEMGFGAKWVIEAQIAQMESGEVQNERAGDLDYEAGTAPWLAWGPYLWADGELSRASDGLSWHAQEFDPADGMHPNMVGQSKVSLILLEFFSFSPFTSCWFMEHGACE